MKRCLIIATLCLIFSTPSAYATGIVQIGSNDHNQIYKDNSTTVNKTIVKKKTVNKSFSNYINNEQENWKVKVELDLPYLVKLKNYWFLGLTVGKDLNNTSAQAGWEGTAKVTYMKTQIDLTKE